MLDICENMWLHWKGKDFSKLSLRIIEILLKEERLMAGGCSGQ